VRFRKTLFWAHLLIGVALGVVILSMCVSGAFLAFEPQITAWSERGFQQVVPPEGAAPLSVQALIEKARAAKADARLSFLTVKPDPGASAVAGFGRQGLLYLNPYTGEVLGAGSKTRAMFRTVEAWHRWLGNKSVGQPITAAAAAAFLLLTLSGICLWWPRRVYSLAGRSHGRNWNWHNTLGITAAPLILLITATGLLMTAGVFKNPADGRRAGEGAARILRPSSERPQTAEAWLVALHTGRLWGMPGQAAHFAAAVTGWLLVWTGLALAWRRLMEGRRRRDAGHSGVKSVEGGEPIVLL